MNDDPHIRIFDTTLRDGQQCPGAAMNLENNLQYARLAAALRFDVIEAGFPAASSLDFQIVRSIAELYAAEDHSPRVAALCQLRDEQIDRTLEALEPAVSVNRAVLHTYVPVDPALMAASLGEKVDKRQIQANLYRFVKRAREAGAEVEFSPEGYSRQGENFDFVTDLMRAAIEAGVSVINCPDTVGGACTWQGNEYFVEKMARHAELMATEFPDHPLIWSVHCHNDFGLAVPNSLSAVFQGPARQIEGCINGVGERAGNAALEALILVIGQFAVASPGSEPFYTQVDVSRLQEISDFVSRHMLPRQPHWPVTGENAAKHSSGGHTNAVLRDPLVYQPFDPRTIGKEISLAFGPLSGGNHAQDILQRAGYLCDDHEKAAIAQYIKDRFHQRRKGITDSELLRAYVDYRGPIRVSGINYSRSDNHSTVELVGEMFGCAGPITGTYDGPDSALAALKLLVDAHFPTQIFSHQSRSDRVGHDANSLSTIVIVDDRGAQFEGIGEDQDIEISAMKAFIQAVNRAYVERTYRPAGSLSAERMS